MTDGGIAKRATGIDGLDQATHGGLPAAGTTLVMGAPGAASGTAPCPSSSLGGPRTPTRSAS